MLTPLVIKDIFDEVFDSSFSGHNSTGMMRTDIKETENEYELLVDVPGVKRENIAAELKDGYLIINATIGQQNNNENQSNGKYIRRERFVGTYKRSFYVGDRVTQEDIKAKFEDGVLHLTVPKMPANQEIEQRKMIAIEG